MKWYEKQAADVAHIKNFYEGRRARADFRLNERVGLACDINTAGGTLQRTAEGKIVEAKTDGSYVVDFGRHGKHLFEAEVAAKALYAIRKPDMRESIRKTLATQVDEALTPGHRVKDADGRQYFIEQADVFGRTFQCIDEKGRTRVLSKHEVTAVNEEEALPGGNPLALAPGSTVVVRGINPALNNIRARAILPAEASGIVGQTGILGFAYYPAGQGSTMYRVILQSGGMKDFSMEELAPAGQMIQANESMRGPGWLSEPSTYVDKDGNSILTRDEYSRNQSKKIFADKVAGAVGKIFGSKSKAPSPPSKEAPSFPRACPHCGK